MDKQKPSPAAQREAFVAAARAAECDEDPAAFDAKMRVLTKVRRAPVIAHASDCAIHNAPAMPAGVCDCGAIKGAR